jgi:hypothetical protein
MRAFIRCGRLLPVLGALLACTACPPGTHTGTFQLINAAPGVLVTELYLMPAGRQDRGPNRLPYPLGVGGVYAIDNLVPGYYDEVAVAVFPATGEFVELANEQILISAGQSYIHTVHFAPDNSLTYTPGRQPYTP